MKDDKAENYVWDVLSVPEKKECPKCGRFHFDIISPNCETDIILERVWKMKLKFFNDEIKKQLQKEIEKITKEKIREFEFIIEEEKKSLDSFSSEIEDTIHGKIHNEIIIHIRKMFKKEEDITLKQMVTEIIEEMLEKPEQFKREDIQEIREEKKRTLHPKTEEVEH